jgi:hypothetical protein
MVEWLIMMAITTMMLGVVDLMMPIRREARIDSMLDVDQGRNILLQNSIAGHLLVDWSVWIDWVLIAFVLAIAFLGVVLLNLML